MSRTLIAVVVLSVLGLAVLALALVVRARLRYFRRQDAAWQPTGIDQRFSGYDKALQEAAGKKHAELHRRRVTKVSSKATTKADVVVFSRKAAR